MVVAQRGPRQRQLALDLLRALAQKRTPAEIAEAHSFDQVAMRSHYLRIMDAARRRRSLHQPSSREIEVIKLVGMRGLTYGQAARLLGLARNTVYEYALNVREKYELTHPEAVKKQAPQFAAQRWALELGLVDDLPF